MRTMLWLTLLFGVGCAGPAAVTVVSAARPEVADDRCPATIAPGGDSAAAPGFEGKPVERVCVVGGSVASRQSLERVGLLRAGDRYTASRLRTDLERLLQLGIFADASAFGLPARGGASVVLFYALRDRPFVTDIVFAGAVLLDPAQLLAELPIEMGSPYDPYRVRQLADSVREAYLSRGYRGCQVTVATEPSGSSDDVRVRIQIEEGPLWRLSRIEFRGQKKAGEVELLEASKLTLGQPLVEEELERADLLISSYFFDRGFVAMRIEREPVTADASGAVRVTFIIDEGAVHTISGLHVTKLGGPFEKELLTRVMKVRTKQVFSRTALLEDISRVREFFARRGQRVEVLPLTEVDAEQHRIDVTLVVESQ